MTRSTQKCGDVKMRIRNVLLSIAVLSLFFLVSPVGVAGAHTITVSPNWHNDTADIQAAFNACVTYGPGCRVQLEKGTYYVAQITVYGFEGSFVGMGQGVTIIQALPNLPSPAPEYNTATSPFWAGLPGSSNPWPALFTFVNGGFSISQMTITDPSENPTEGWVLAPSGTTYTALYSAIIITGDKQASASIDHVTMIGASGDEPEGTNMFNGILYGGELLPPGYSLISGTFSVTNSVFNTMESGPWAGEVDGATFTVCYNTAINDPGVTYIFTDLYNSKLTVCGNRGSGSQFTAAMGVIQDFTVPPPTGVSPSSVYITDNNFQASQGANAVYLYDGYNTLKAVVSGNTLTTDSACTATWQAEGWCYNEPWSTYVPPEWFSSVVVSYSLINVVVSQNTIFGGGKGSTNNPANGVYVTGGPGQVSGNTVTGSYIGVWLDAAKGAQAAAMHNRSPRWGHHGLISGNTITPTYDVLVSGNIIKNSAEYGIALTDGSSNNIVSYNIVSGSGVYDLYWDRTGTGNVWTGNQYKTKSAGIVETP
jgi:parallel beta-helix repeat protein